MKIKKHLPILLAASIVSVPAAQAQWIVNDPVNLVQNTQQVLTLIEQLDNLKNQLITLEDQLDAMTGARGYGALLPDAVGVLRNNLPEDFDRVYTDAMNSGSAITAPARAILEQFDMQIHGLERGDALDFINAKMREKGAYDRAMASKAYNNQMRELEDIQALTEQIDSTTTTKEIMDLQARIDTAQGAIQGEQAKLQLMAMLQQSQDKLLDHQKELAVRRYTIGVASDDNTPPRLFD